MTNNGPKKAPLSSPGAADGGSSASRSGGSTACSSSAIVAVAFAVGFGAALQLSMACASGTVPEQVRSICPATGVLHASVGTQKPPPPRAEAEPRQRSITKTIGAGGVGAARGRIPGPPTHPTMATEGWNWTQLSMSRRSNFRDDDIKRITAEDVKREGAVGLARSQDRSRRCQRSRRRVRQRHPALDQRRVPPTVGANKVVVAFSDSAKFNHGEDDPEYGRVVVHPDRVQKTFVNTLT